MRAWGIGLVTAMLASVPVVAGSADTPLHDAAIRGDVAAAERLLAGGVDVNLRDQQKRTPLTLALDHKQIEMAQWLLDHGAKPSARDAFYLRRLKVPNPASTPEAPKSKRGTPQPGVYDEIARATGGAVYRFPKSNMNGLADIMTATLGSETVVNREVDLAGIQRLQVAVEPGWERMVVTVTAVGGKPGVSWVDAQGANVAGSHPPPDIQAIDLENGSVFIIPNPAPGDWIVTLNGRGNVHFKVDAKRRSGGAGRFAGQSRPGVKTGSGEIEIYKVEFVELQGRPGHEGYFKSTRPLMPGASRLAEITLFGQPEGVRMQLVSLEGGPLAGTGGSLKPLNHEGNDFLFEIKIPAHPFRFKLTGRDPQGRPWEQLDGSTFTPDSRLSVLAFQPRHALDVKDCMTAKGFLQVIHSSHPEASGFIRCDLTGLDPPQFKFEMSFYLPPPAKAQHKRILFSPDSRYRYDASQCETLRDFLDKFEKRAHSLSAQAERTAACITVNGKPRLDIQLAVTGGSIQ